MGASVSTAGVKVVIIGGGAAGCALISKLAGRVDLTLIEPRDRAFHNVAAPRALVEAGTEERLFAPYMRILGKGTSRHVRGSALSVDTAARLVKVRLHSGAESDVPYDVLVIATGTGGLLPSQPVSASSGDSQAALAEIRTALAAAETIAVVGGGPVGFEVCGELRTDFPGKAVHLVHAHAELLSGAGNGNLLPAFRAKAAAKLTALGVQLHLGERAKLPAADAALPAGVHSVAGGGALLGRLPLALAPSGTVLHPDVTIVAFAGKPNSAAFRTGGLAGAINADGCLAVNEHFQVRGEARVLSFGDVCGSGDPKTVYAATMLQLPTVFKVVLALARALAANPAADLAALRLASHVPSPKPGLMVMSAGRNGGVGQLGTMLVGDWFARTIKSRTLFLDKFNAGMGYGGKAGLGYPGAPPPERSTGGSSALPAAV